MSGYRDYTEIAAEMMGIPQRVILRADYFTLLEELRAIDSLVKKSSEEGGLVSRQVIASIIHNWEKGRK